MKKRERLKYVLVGALVVALLSSIYLGIRTNDSLQACLEKNRKGSRDMALHFHISVGRATSITYLLLTYREGLGETEPSEDNIEALIGGFFHEMDYAYHGFLRRLMTLNPELSEYEKPLYFIDRFIGNIIRWQSFPTAGPTVRSVLYHLLSEAHSLANYSIPLTAFKELNQTSFQKIDDLGREVAESFTWKGVNATRLDNAVSMVEELETILSQWMDTYSETQQAMISEQQAIHIGRDFLDGIGCKTGEVLLTNLEDKTPNFYWHDLAELEKPDVQGLRLCWVIRFEQAYRLGHFFEVWIDAYTGEVIGGIQCK